MEKPEQRPISLLAVMGWMLYVLATLAGGWGLLLREDTREGWTL